MSDHHLLSISAIDKDGHRVYPYKGKLGAKKGLYSVNFTHDNRQFQGMTEEQLTDAIYRGRFRDRGTIRMCRLTSSSGSNAFAPVVFGGKHVKNY